MALLRWPLLLASVAAGNAAPTPPFGVSKYDHHIEANGAVAYWKIAGDVLMLGLAGEGWWTGFGMNSRPTMQYADIVVCQQSQDDPDLIEAIDYHATANSQPKMDYAQDWFVVSSGRLASPLTTWCELNRSLTTCSVAEDWQITDVEKVILGLLAWSGRGGSQPSKLSYHGLNRRHQLMSFDGKTSEAAGAAPPKSGSGGGWSTDPSAITWEGVVPSVTVPSASGSNVYTYSKVDLPSGNTPYHAIAWRNMADQDSDSVKAGLNHHMTTYKCKDGIPGAKEGSEVSPWDVMKHCEHWLGGVNTLPEDEGIPFDGAGKEAFYIVVERHFYNPTNKKGVTDSNGKVALVFTDNLRPKVMSQLVLANFKIKVPGKTYGYVHRSHCPAECTAKMGDIRVARVSFHAHSHTTAATLRHIRAGDELEPILHVEPYDDSLAFTSADRLIKAGDELIMDCVYNNDMDTEIVFGMAIEQEMCMATLDIIGLTSVKACSDAPGPQEKWEGYDQGCSWCVDNNNFKDHGCNFCDLSKGLIGCPKDDTDLFIPYDPGRFGDPNSMSLNGDPANDGKILKYRPFQLNEGKTCTAADGYVEEVTMGTPGSCPAGSTVSGSTLIPFPWGGGLTISWDADCDNQEVTFTVWRVRNGAAGWMAFGMHDAGTVDLSVDMPSNRMAGADIVQFTVEDSTMKDAKGEDYTAPRDKTTPVAALISAEHANGKHTAVFKRPFVSPDGVTLRPEGFVWIIAAVNAFTSDKGVKHATAFAIDAEPISLFGGTPTKRLLRQHSMTTSTPLSPGQPSKPTEVPTTTPTSEPADIPTPTPPGQNPTSTPPAPEEESGSDVLTTTQTSKPAATPTTTAGQSPTSAPPAPEDESSSDVPTTTQTSKPAATPTPPPSGQSPTPALPAFKDESSSDSSAGTPAIVAKKAANATQLQMTIVVQNVSFDDLAKDSAVMNTFKMNVKAVVAAEAGADILPEHVEVALSAGSIKVETTITPPAGVDVTALSISLGSSSTSLTAAVVNKIQEDPALVAIASGSITARVTVAPSAVAVTEVAANDEVSVTSTASGISMARLGFLLLLLSALPLRSSSVHGRQSGMSSIRP